MTSDQNASQILEDSNFPEEELTSIRRLANAILTLSEVESQTSFVVMIEEIAGIIMTRADQALDGVLPMQQSPNER